MREISAQRLASPELTLVVPTFNEKDNIAPLVERVGKVLAGTDWEIVFVDDNSPDGTAAEVRRIAGVNSRVRVLHRIGRRGLAGAVIEGCLSSVAPVVAVMDADLQHDETRLAPMLDMLRGDPGLDLVVASRSLPGGSADEGLSQGRQAGSRIATVLAQRALGITVSDPMSGFFMLRRERFSEVAPTLQHEGFKVLADMLAASGGRWQVAEIPYRFRAREHGESKMGLAVTLEFIALLLARRSGGLLPVRFVLFLAVGLTGVVVQLAVLRLMLFTVTDLFALAQAVGVLAAMTSNFLLNNAITYRDRRLRGRGLVVGLVSFYGVCSIGALANVGVAEAVWRQLPQPEIASLAGAAVGAVWNYVASALFTWRAR